MKNKSLKLPIIIIVAGIILAIVACLLLSMQKMPTVTKQDFDFSITYKLDGETKTLNGVYSRTYLFIRRTACTMYHGICSSSLMPAGCMVTKQR